MLLHGLPLTVHVVSEPVVPAALDVLQPVLGSSGRFPADQLAQLPDSADVFHRRIAAAVSDEGAQVDRRAALAGRSPQNGSVDWEGVPQQVRAHLLVASLCTEVHSDVRDVSGQKGAGATANKQAGGRQQQRGSGRWNGEHIGGRQCSGSRTAATFVSSVDFPGWKPLTYWPRIPAGRQKSFPAFKLTSFRSTATVEYISIKSHFIKTQYLCLTCHRTKTGLKALIVSLLRNVVLNKTAAWCDQKTILNKLINT